MRIFVSPILSSSHHRIKSWKRIKRCVIVKVNKHKFPKVIPKDLSVHVLSIRWYKQSVQTAISSFSSSLFMILKTIVIQDWRKRTARARYQCRLQKKWRDNDEWNKSTKSGKVSKTTRQVVVVGAICVSPLSLFSYLLWIVLRANRHSQLSYSSLFIETRNWNLGINCFASCPCFFFQPSSLSLSHSLSDLREKFRVSLPHGFSSLFLGNWKRAKRAIIFCLPVKILPATETQETEAAEAPGRNRSQSHACPRPLFSQWFRG